MQHHPNRPGASCDPIDGERDSRALSCRLVSSKDAGTDNLLGHTSHFAYQGRGDRSSVYPSEIDFLYSFQIPLGNKIVDRLIFNH